MHEIENTLKSVVDSINKACKAGNGLPINALPTGYFELDKQTNGIKLGKLYAFAGPPASCKSSLLINLASNMARDAGVNVVFLSYVFNASDVLSRMLSLSTKLSLSSLMCGHLHDEQWVRLQRRLAGFSSTNNLFLYNHLEVEKNLGGLKALILKTQSANPENKTVLFVDDALQCAVFHNMSGKKRLQYLRSLAMEVNIAIIISLPVNMLALSHKTEKRPQIVDLRLHEAVGKWVDTIITLHRPMADLHLPLLSNVIELSTLKNNNGSTGFIKLHFDRQSLAIGNYGTQDSDQVDVN